MFLDRAWDAFTTSTGEAVLMNALIPVVHGVRPKNSSRHVDSDRSRMYEYHVSVLVLATLCYKEKIGQARRHPGTHTNDYLKLYGCCGCSHVHGCQLGAH